MRFEELNRRLVELALSPKTRKQAERRTIILPPNKKEAESIISDFWKVFLNNNRGTSAESSVSKVPSYPFDEHISVKQSKEKVSGKPFMWLEWHGSVTFRIVPGIMFTFMITTLDNPGQYRVDYILQGAKKAKVQEVREQVSKYIVKHQNNAKASLTDEEKAFFDRLHVSTKKVPHSHKDGVRDDSKLIGRINLDDVPLYKLVGKASDLKDITVAVGDIVFEVMNESQ